MTNIKKILVPFDDNLRSIRALEYAAMLASGIPSEITALHLLHKEDYHSKAELIRDLNDLVTEELQPKLKQIQQNFPEIKKIKLQTLGFKSTIHEHVIDFAGENKFDFIVMRSHGVSKASDWEVHFKTTNAYKVVMEAKCPVFTFSSIPEKPKINNILVPLDLTDGTLYKVPLAMSLAKQFDATLHLLSTSEHEDDHEDLTVQLKGTGELIEKRGISVIKTPLYKGTLPEAVNSYTSKNEMDLVVIMNRPGFRWSDLWISPKAKRVISQSKIPVVSIRSDRPFESEL